MSEVRKFAPVKGFNSCTKYIVWNSSWNKCSFERRDGSIDHSCRLTLQYCLECVKKGTWIEIKQDGEKCSGCSCNSGARIDVVGGSGTNFINGIFDSMFESFGIPKTPPEPIDFSTAQVGDTVRCLLNGDVVIEAIDESSYPFNFVDVEFSYRKDGRRDKNDKNLCLIGFVDSDGKLCRTRPEPKIDWSKVAIDAPVEIKFAIGRPEILHYAGIIGPITGNPMFWTRGRTSQTTKQHTSHENATYKLINTEEK